MSLTGGLGERREGEGGHVGPAHSLYWQDPRWRLWCLNQCLALTAEYLQCLPFWYDPEPRLHLSRQFCWEVLGLTLSLRTSFSSPLPLGPLARSSVYNFELLPCWSWAPHSLDTLVNISVTGVWWRLSCQQASTCSRHISCTTETAGAAQGAGLRPLHAGRNETKRDVRPPRTRPPGEGRGPGLCVTLFVRVYCHMANDSILSSVRGLQTDLVTIQRTGALTHHSPLTTSHGKWRRECFLSHHQISAGNFHYIVQFLKKKTYYLSSLESLESVRHTGPDWGHILLHFLKWKFHT